MRCLTSSANQRSAADARQEAPKIAPEGCAPEGHEDIGRRIPEQRIGEDRAPAVFVGQKTAGYRADEQRCDEVREAGAISSVVYPETPP